MCYTFPILLVGILFFSCGRVERSENSAVTEAEDSLIEAKENVNDAAEISEQTIDWNSVNSLVEQKFQEATDLYGLINDSLLPAEMKLEAEKTLESFVKTKKDREEELGKVEILSINPTTSNDNYATVVYTLNGVKHETFIIIDRKNIAMEDGVFQALEVTIGEF